MGEAKRKTYTASFKAKVGLEAIREVKTANEIGQEHGVHFTPIDGTYQAESAHFRRRTPRQGGEDNPKGHALLSFY